MAAEIGRRGKEIPLPGWLTHPPRYRVVPPPRPSAEEGLAPLLSGDRENRRPQTSARAKLTDAGVWLQKEAPIPPRHGEGEPRDSVVGGVAGAPMANANARRLRKVMTPQEVKLWVHLRTWRAQHGYHFRRQVPRLGYILDFACLARRLAVEVDGGQHGGARDAERDRRLAEAGFRVLRFWNNDVDGNMDGVLQAILAALKATPPTTLRGPPSPAFGRGGIGALFGIVRGSGGRCFPGGRGFPLPA